MKKLLLLLIPVSFLIILSCQQNPNRNILNCCLSSEDSLLIINEINASTDNYAKANIDIDAEKCAEFFDSSSDFVFAETGKEYANWDSLYLDIKNWYSQPLDSVKMIWEERNIKPLSHEVAILYSRLFFRAKFKSGVVYESNGSLSGLMTKKSGNWKMTVGYLSIKVLNNQ